MKRVYNALEGMDPQFASELRREVKLLGKRKGIGGLGNGDSK